MTEPDLNYDERVRESVIEDVRSGQTDISRSGGWAAERFSEWSEIRVYKVVEVIEDE